MYVIGYATAEEIADLEAKEFEVEDVPARCIAPVGDEMEEGYLLTKPESGPSGTRAIAVFLEMSVYKALINYIVRHNVHLNASVLLKNLQHWKRIFVKPNFNSLSVAAYTARRDQLREDAEALRADAEDFRYCSHKNPDGGDARYFVEGGMGARSCVCGNKWD
jgi:hypothetical protein